MSRHAAVVDSVRRSRLASRAFGWLCCAWVVGSVSAGCGKTHAPAMDGTAGDEAVADAGAPPTGASGPTNGGANSGGTQDNAPGGVNAGSGADAAAAGNTGVVPGTTALRGAPLVFAPTSSELGINVALASGDGSPLAARFRRAGSSGWETASAPRSRADDLLEWRLSGLEPGTTYEYQITDDAETDPADVLYTGRAVTQRAAGESFRFALISDPHIGANLDYGNQGDEDVLHAVGDEVGAAQPDFLLNLGDTLDFHQFGFNSPPPDAGTTRAAYLNYRASFGDALGTLGHFGVIGNWDGESGSYTSEEIERSRSQRLLYVPNPAPDTYAEGGSQAQDYYAFTWGDALFVVLNVMSYTPTEHLLGSGTGTADDWTLGAEQFTWLRQTLERATSKWRFLFIHHTVGGNAGNDANSSYGRGGGRAAYVGEQAEIQQLMLDHGVQVFFYAHDHVFTDMVVDGVHYSGQGNAGAIWTFTSDETGYSTFWNQSGWTQVDVTPKDVHVQFKAVGADPLYDYTLEP